MRYLFGIYGLIVLLTTSAFSQEVGAGPDSSNGSGTTALNSAQPAAATKAEPASSTQSGTETGKKVSPAPGAAEPSKDQPGGTTQATESSRSGTGLVSRFLSESVVRFHREHLIIAVILDITAAVLILVLAALAFTDWREYAWYFLLPALALLGTLEWSSTDYFWVFVLGMATACAEIISKFPDEPLKSLKTGHAVAYHAFNGIIAAFALYALTLFADEPTTPADRLKIVVGAGLGAMLIMRSKLFNIKVGGEDVSFGPEQIVKIFLSFMEQAIDRIRARKRIEFLKGYVDKVDHARFDDFIDHIDAMLRASQTRTNEQKESFVECIQKIRGGDKAPKGGRNKCYAVCFELLNGMGEDFVMEVFKNMPANLRSVAPSPPDPGIFGNMFGGEQSLRLGRCSFTWRMAVIWQVFASGSD